jgi:hypothetical protein
MLKYVFAAVVYMLVATPSEAALYRLSVTGSAGGFLLADRVTDLEGNLVDVFVEVDFGLISEDQIPGLIPEFLRSTSGLALFDSSGSVTGCRGLLTFLCSSRVSPYKVGTFVFDDLLNTFDFEFIAIVGGVSANQDGLSYGDDEGFDVTVGELQYLFAGTGGAFLEAQFTSVDVSKVPGPASALLLAPAVGLLAVMRRRRNMVTA